MSKRGLVVVAWGDGDHAFRLGLSQIEEIEDKSDKSIFDIAKRMSPQSRNARTSEIWNVLRCGLIGGGMSPVDAMAKVRRYGEERPIDESRDVAYAVLLAGLARVHSEEVASGEAEAPN